MSDIDAKLDEDAKVVLSLKTTNTRDKLNEAYYFLERVKDISKEFDVRNIPALRYNMSAFLNAFRGVTYDVMQIEYEHVPGFTNWFNSEWGRLQGEDPNLRFIRDARDRNVHRKQIGINTITFSIFPAENLPPANIYFSSVIDRRGRVVTRPTEDAITVCSDALVKLESFITECESRFPL